MTNAEKHVQNQLTYFSKGGYDFEVLSMTADKNVLKCNIIVSKDGDRVKLSNPITMHNPEINVFKNGEAVEDVREAFKEVIYNLI